MNDTSNIPEYLQAWLNEKAESNTYHWQLEQDRTFDVLVAAGIPESDLTRVDIGDGKYVRVEPLGMTLWMNNHASLNSIDDNRDTIDWRMIYGSTTIQVAIRDMYMDAAEQRRLAALPKYIEYRPRRERTDSLIDWVNENAADGYVLDKYISDGEGYIYAVMVREA